MRVLPLALMIGSLVLAGCATTRMSDSDELALYMNHAGEPIRKVSYREPIAWDDVGDSHLLLTIKPSEGWLFRLAPNCLDWSGSGPALSLSHMGGVVSSRFDKVTRLGPGTPMSCRIEEIRVVDLAAVRAARRSMASTP